MDFQEIDDKIEGLAVIIVELLESDSTLPANKVVKLIELSGAFQKYLEDNK